MIMRYTKRKWKKQRIRRDTNMDYESWKLTNRLWDKCPGTPTNIVLSEFDKPTIGKKFYFKLKLP